MRSIIILFVLLPFVFISKTIRAQDRNFYNSKDEEITVAGKHVLYNLTIVIDKNGNRSSGFLFGLKSDSLILIRNEEKHYYSIRDLLNIEIEFDRNNYKGLYIGIFAGIYAGNIIFYTAENQPTAYWDNDNVGAKVAVSLLFAFVGGGIGYLTDLAIEEGQEANSFNFKVSGQKWLEEFERLKSFLLGVKEKRNLIDVNFILSQVKTRYSEIQDNSDFLLYYYDHVSSFNLLRRFQVVYALSSYFDVGGSICWFGEPYFQYYSYDWSYEDVGISRNVSQKYEGVGYYASAVYYPFKSVFSKIVSWSISAGIGIGNVSYLYEYVRTIENYPNFIEEKNNKEINKDLFSAMISTQFDLNLIDELSLGLVADYIYVPGKMPAIPNTNTSERGLSNFSFGLAFGLHF